MVPVRERATSALLGLVMLPGLFLLGLPAAFIVVIAIMGLVTLHPALGMVVPLCAGAALMCRAGTLELSRVSRAILYMASAAMLVSAGSIGVVCSAGCLEKSWHSNAIDAITVALVVMGVIAAIAAMTASRRTALLLVGTAATVTLAAFVLTVITFVGSYGFPAVD